MPSQGLIATGNAWLDFTGAREFYSGAKMAGRGVMENWRSVVEGHALQIGEQLDLFGEFLIRNGQHLMWQNASEMGIEYGAQVVLPSQIVGNLEATAVGGSHLAADLAGIAPLGGTIIGIHDAVEACR